MLISTNNYVTVTCYGTFKEFIVVWVFTFRDFQIPCINDLRIQNKPL